MNAGCPFSLIVAAAASAAVAAKDNASWLHTICRLSFALMYQMTHQKNIPSGMQ